MASYALLGALAGFRYSAVQRTLWFGPQLSVLPFKTFFSTASGFGTITLDERSLLIQMIEGELPLEKIVVTTARKPEPWLRLPFGQVRPQLRTCEEQAPFRAVQTVIIPCKGSAISRVRRSSTEAKHL
jgi:hypothetical protein